MIKSIICSFFIGFLIILLLDDISGGKNAYVNAYPNPDKDYTSINTRIYQLHEVAYQTAYYIEMQDGEETVQYHLVFSSKIDQAKVNEYSLKDKRVEIEGFVGYRDFKNWIYVTNIRYPK